MDNRLITPLLDDLPEPKLIYQTSNAGHNLNGGTQALQTLAAFFELIADKKPLPKLTWQFTKVDDTHISVEIRIDQQVNSFTLWNAHSKDRNFRNNKWMSKSLDMAKNNRHASSLITIPIKGYQTF